MTEEQAQNLLKYGQWALIGAVIATGLQLAAVLAGTDDIAWRPLAATFVGSLFGSLATAVGTARLTRVGSEAVAAQVNDLRQAGVPRSDMIVVDGVATMADQISAMSPDKRRALVDEMMRRNAEANTAGVRFG